jgi:tetratricopeptide (TPR) repeat protein
MRHRIPTVLSMLLFFNSYLANGSFQGPGMNEYYENGMKKFEEGNFKGAIRDFTKIIKLNPDCFWAYNCRAMARIELKEFRLAFSDLKIVLKHSPSNHEAVYLKGLIRERRGEYEKAQKLYTEAIRLSPDFTLAFIRRAYSLFKLGEYAFALNDVNHALFLDPLNPEALQTKSLIRYTMEEMHVKKNNWGMTRYRQEKTESHKNEQLSYFY